MRRTRATLAALAALAASAVAAPAAAQWKPERPVEFIAAAGPGGGTDTFARVVQSALSRNNLLTSPIIVSNKAGGSGAEAFIYARTSGGDPHKLFFGTQEGASAQTFYGWRIDRSGDDVPLARALVGDAATFDFGPGTTVAELQEGAGDAVEVEEGVADFGPSFTVTDQSSGFSGFIDGEGPDGVVRNVFGGEGCGE